MKKHKHCRQCGEIIVPSQYDEELSDLKSNDTMVFHKDVCYKNCFFFFFVLEYSIERLIEWFYRGDKI